MAAREAEFERFAEADARFVAAMQAGGLLMAGYRVDLEHFELENGDLAEVMALRKAMRVEMDELQFRLGGFDGHARGRLASALAIARRDDRHRHVVDVLIEFLVVYRELLPMIARLRERWLVQETLMSNVGRFGMTGIAQDRLNALVTEMAPIVQRILKATEGKTYPFPHYCGEIALNDFVRLELPSEKDLVHPHLQDHRGTTGTIDRALFPRDGTLGAGGRGGGGAGSG